MLSVSDAIKCMDGPSTGTPKEKDCGDKIKVCLKTAGSAGGSSAAIYACGVEGQEAKDECKEQELAGVKSNVCMCKTDLCNGAGQLSSATAMFMTLAGLIATKLMF